MEHARAAAEDAVKFYNSFAIGGRRLTVLKRAMGWIWEFALPLVVGAWAGVLLMADLLE